MTPAEVIAALSEAKEGSRELDEDIAAALVGAIPEVQSGGRRAWHRDNHWVSIEPAVKPWTTSIDAALTLLPDGWWAEIYARTDAPSCILWEFPLPCRRVPAEKPYVISASTVALALCIAALRARLTPSPQGQEVENG